MELTVIQYNDIERYMKGGMEASEREAFEASLLQDDELAKEVQTYREILSLTDAIEQKINETAQLSSEKKITDKDVREMLEKERKYCEAHHEPELKRIHGLAGSMNPP